MMDTLVGAIIFALIWAAWNFDVNPFSDEISLYRQVKECPKNNNSCEWVNLPKTDYKVNENTQSVIYWRSNKEGELYRGENCIVRNKKNWTCGNTYKYGFYDGEWIYRDSDQIKSVSKTTWWVNDLPG